MARFKQLRKTFSQYTAFLKSVGCDKKEPTNARPPSPPHQLSKYYYEG